MLCMPCPIHVSICADPCPAIAVKRRVWPTGFPCARLQVTAGRLAACVRLAEFERMKPKHVTQYDNWHIDIAAASRPSGPPRRRCAPTPSPTARPAAAPPEFISRSEHGGSEHSSLQQCGGCGLTPRPAGAMSRVFVVYMTFSTCTSKTIAVVHVARST
eukprot:6577955-Prymnesium_polylepis.2